MNGTKAPTLRVRRGIANTQDMFGIPLKEGEEVWCVQGVESPMFTMRTPFFRCVGGDFGRLSVQDDPLIKKALFLARRLDHRNNASLEDFEYFFPRDPTILNVVDRDGKKALKAAYLLGKTGTHVPSEASEENNCSEDQRKIQALIGDLKVHEINPYIFVVPDVPMGVLATALSQSLTEDLGSSYEVVITNGSKPELQNILVIAKSAPQDPIRESRGRMTGGPSFESNGRYGVSFTEQVQANENRIRERALRGFELRNYLIRSETYESMVALGRSGPYLETELTGTCAEMEQKVQTFLEQAVLRAEKKSKARVDDDLDQFIYMFRSLFHLSSRASSHVATPLDLAMVMLGVGVPMAEVVKRLVDQVAFMSVLSGAAINVKSAAFLGSYDAKTKAVFKILKRNITMAG